MCFVQWFDTHWGFALSFLTFVYVIGTLLIYWINRMILGYYKKIRIEEKIPILVASNESISLGSSTQIINKWFIKNVGGGPALNVEVRGTKEMIVGTVNEDIYKENIISLSSGRVAIGVNAPFKLFPNTGPISETVDIPPERLSLNNTLRGYLP